MGNAKINFSLCDCTHENARRILKQGKYESVVITEAIYPQGQRIEKHCHPLPNLGLVMRGSCTHAVAGCRDAETCVPGELHYLPSGEHHAFSFQSDARCLLARVNPPTLERLREYVKVDLPSGKQVGEVLRGLSTRLIWEFRQDDDLTALAIDGLILEIFAGMNRFHRLPSCKPSSAVLRARSLLHDAASGPLTFGHVAREVDVHPVHLAREFRKAFKRSMSEYVREIRVQKALQLLVKSEVAMSEISQLCGFCDQAHFSKCFKKVIGVSPLEYRREVGYRSQQCKDKN